MELGAAGKIKSNIKLARIREWVMTEVRSKRASAGWLDRIPVAARRKRAGLGIAVALSLLSL